MGKLGYTPEKVGQRINEWLECGVLLCRLFRFDDIRMSVAQKARLYHYYIPVFLWCEDQIESHRAAFKDGDEIPPLVVRWFSNLSSIDFKNGNHFEGYLFILISADWSQRSTGKREDDSRLCSRLPLPSDWQVSSRLLKLYGDPLSVVNSVFNLLPEIRRHYRSMTSI